MSFALASSRRALLPAARQLQKAANLTPSRRGVATVSHVDESIARVTMCAPPVNTMNLAFIEELTATIQQIEADKNVNALILDSSCKVFSAGLDLKTMHGATNDELAHFWTAFRTLWMSIYDSRLATITAIQGPSPAGGCLMAIASDARIMSANANIGLNEAAFGLVVPVWGNTAMIDIMGRRQAEKAVSLGTMFKAQRAYDLGLIDTLVDSPDDVPAEAEAEARRWATVGRADTKKVLRKDMVAHFHATKQEDVDNFVSLVSSDRIQNALGAYIASLKK